MISAPKADGVHAGIVARIIGDHPAINHFHDPTSSSFMSARGDRHDIEEARAAAIREGRSPGCSATSWGCARRLGWRRSG